MSDYATETIKRCAEINGPCWECEARGDCKMLEDAAKLLEDAADDP